MHFTQGTAEEASGHISLTTGDRPPLYNVGKMLIKEKMNLFFVLEYIIQYHKN